jgi:hypothetical protein
MKSQDTSTRKCTGHGPRYAAHILRPRQARINLRTDQSHSSELPNERRGECGTSR